MAKVSEPLVISDVLNRHSKGQRLLLREAQAVTGAAVGLRNEFLDDMFRAMQNPAAVDLETLRFMVGIAKLLSMHGFISSKEIDNFMVGIGMLE